MTHDENDRIVDANKTITTQFDERIAKIEELRAYAAGSDHEEGFDDGIDEVMPLIKDMYAHIVQLEGKK